MKRLLFFLLLIPSLAWGQCADVCKSEPFQVVKTNPYIAGAVSAATCNTQASPTDMVTQSGTEDIGNLVSKDFWGTAFVSDGSTICSVQLYLGTSTGSDPSFASLTVKIYGDDGTTDCDGLSCPNEADIKADFGTISTVGLGASPGWKAASGSGPFTGANGTTYHVVVNTSGVDNTNKLTWANDSTCTTEHYSYSGDGAAWTSASKTYCLNVKFYKAP